jgi:agmatinase
MRITDYLPHDGSRPSLALGVDPLVELGVVDLGDVEMPSGYTDLSLERLEDHVARIAAQSVIPVILGGDHTIALPDVTGIARHVGFGRVAVIHFDAHADTAENQFGSLQGHGTPMRTLIESGACRGDRFIQIGLRGYWPEGETLDWMAAQGMRSFEMSEIVARGLNAVLDEAFAIATDDCDAVFLSVDVDVVDPGSAPGTGTPEPGGLTSRQLLDAVRRIAMELPLAGMDVVEVAPPYDHADITAFLGNRVVLEALGGIAWRRARDAGRPVRDPAAPLLAR